MSVLDRKPAVKGPKIPAELVEKTRRGRDAMMRDAPRRRLAVKFWQGEHYWFVDQKGGLDFLPTVTHARGGKPPHRIRNTYNFLHTIVEGKVSQATQRVPSYEVLPATTDPKDWSAAKLSQQIALYGYDQWNLRRATTKVVTNALVQREGFAMPYFDPNVGPFKPVLNKQDEIEYVGQGEIKILTLSRNEVYWEAGVDFSESRWHCIERARPISEVEKIPGFVGGKLVADASTSDHPSVRKDQDDLVLTTEYFERPCSDYPRGRKMTMANGAVIVDARLINPKATTIWEDYPSVDPNGEVLDEPALHRLSYTVDPEGDDRGLVEHLLDLQRTVNDCWNKLLEWKNRCLNPQMKAPVGSMKGRVDDVPGAVRYYNPVGGLQPEWEQPPPVPRELFSLLDQAISHMRAVASDIDVQAEPDLAAKTAQAAIENSRARWQSFLGDLAEFHSRLMRHCLSLVQVYYTEPRLMLIRGESGTEPLPDFTGENLRGQVAIRVQPQSLEVKSRAAAHQELEFLLANYPGMIPMESALMALSGGQIDKLVETYNGHIRRATALVQRFREGPQVMNQFLPRFDNRLGMEVPGWMPRVQDNIPIHKKVFGDFMITEAYERLPVETQAIFDIYWQGLEFVEQQAAIREAMMQQQMAEGLGMANAAKPQGNVQQPSKPGLSSGPPSA